MRTAAKALAIVLLGAIGFTTMRVVEWAWVTYQQHVVMWQWTQETDRLIHPQKYAPPAPQPPVAPQAPEPTPTVKK